MAYESYPWLKLNLDYLHDPDLRDLPKNIQANYFYFYMLACKGAAEGLLTLNGKVLTSEKLSVVLGISIDEVVQSLETLESAGLMHWENGYIITRFLDEQGPSGPGDVQEKKREYWRKAQSNKRNKVKENKTE